MFSRYFIERPVLSNTIAILMMLLGGAAIAGLPVAQYTSICPPTIQVTASYPGASARTMAEKVALPIEQQVNGVRGMLYMQSSCSNNGNYTLVVTFAIGTDPNRDQVLVQNRVAAATAQLPQPVQKQGVVVQTKSTAILQIVTLFSPDDRFDALFLNNYATLRLENEIERISGVGGVTVFGVGPYSMRIWLRPDELQARSLTPNDIISAIRTQNLEVAAGKVGGAPCPPEQAFELSVRANGTLASVKDFGEIIVKSDPADGGRITRLKDVARVEFGSQQYGQFFKLDGHAAGGMAIYQLPGANSLTTARLVREKMQELAKDFPPGLSYTIPFDTTIFVSESVRDVCKTLIEAGLLVLVVIMIFLGDWRATLVPATTVPVSIIGAFAGMAALGFTINTLTLLALVLAIGIVVDDAIVVVEGTTRHLERGLSPREAAVAAMRELMGPIIGVTLVLMSVFLPAAFLPGITGQMYRQFALVIAVTALLSGINAMTLKPTQCALWLRSRKESQAAPGLFSRGLSRIEHAYAALIGQLARRSLLGSLAATALTALAIWGIARTPTSFIPTEDQGYLMVAVQLPDASSLEKTREAMGRLAERISTLPGVAHVIQIGGISPIDNNASLANAGILYVMLQPWNVRGKKESLLPMYQAVCAAVAPVQEANSLVLVPPPIPGLGLAGGFQVEIEQTDGSFDYTRLQKATESVVSALGTNPAIRMALSPFRATVPQLSFEANRNQARTYDVAISDLYDTLDTYVGSSYVGQIVKYGRNFNIYAQADASFRHRPEEIGNLTVRNRQGGMVPLGSLATIRSDTGPAIVSLYNLYPDAAILGGGAQGFSSGEVMALVERTATRLLPPGMRYEWTAMSYQEKLAGSAVVLVFLLSLILVYFVLAGLYESWSAPLAVILSVPLALLGTLVALRLTHLPDNIYVQIGLVLLIALSAKNAILIVEAARELITEGNDPVSAAVEASRRRFRPILMTSVTFILGALPLVLASGAGSSARKVLGLTVISGMLASTCLALLVVPCFFVLFQRPGKTTRKP